VPFYHQNPPNPTTSARTTPIDLEKGSTEPSKKGQKETTQSRSRPIKSMKDDRQQKKRAYTGESMGKEEQSFGINSEIHASESSHVMKKKGPYKS